MALWRSTSARWLPAGQTAQSSRERKADGAPHCLFALGRQKCLINGVPIFEKLPEHFFEEAQRTS
jgi:hypothetical protein